MPSTSDKQKNFMKIAAHNSGFAKKAGIKQDVAKEFEKADEAKGSKKVTKDMVKKRYGGE